MPVVIAGVAVIMDLRTGRVDNGWILFSLGTGFFIQCMGQGWAGIFEFLSGAIVPLLILGMLFVFRMLGPGDIKLLCALGGIMGPLPIAACILISLCLGAGISSAILISNGGVRQRLHYFTQYFHDFVQSGKLKPYYRKGMSRVENFHFTVPVFLSVMLYAGGVY
ncbi:MAG: prepilin peptidase [Eubacteriales bacterium]|nr:prepilin peptidase [Eubacteriales bacterium]